MNTIQTIQALTRVQVNRMVRVLLLVVALGSLALTILAARPPTRHFGPYPAEVGTPAAIYADGGVPAAFVTLTDPAVISFPDDWHVPEQLCMVIRIDRGDAGTALEFNDYPPQIDWDIPAQDTLMINNQLIEGHASNNAIMTLGNDTLKTLIDSRLPYLVSWIGQATTPLYKGKPLGGLACVTFTLEAKNRIPPFLFLTFGVKNTHVEHYPAFYFRFNDPTPPNTQPPTTLTLQKRTMADYFADLLTSAPFVVRRAPLPG